MTAAQTIVLAALGAALIVVLVLIFRAAIRRGERHIEDVITEWEAQRDAAPADSTYLDPHRGPGPVLVSPDEGDWRTGWGQR